MRLGAPLSATKGYTTLEVERVHTRALELCRQLDVPFDTYIHDYASFCPRISLLGPDRRYCGEPDASCVREGIP